jgi:hypothetical protein
MMYVFVTIDSRTFGSRRSWAAWVDFRWGRDGANPDGPSHWRALPSRTVIVCKYVQLLFVNNLTKLSLLCLGSPQHTMVLGLIALAATVPMTATSVLGLQEKAESTKNNGNQPEWKTEKCHMRCRATDRTPDNRKELFSGSQVVVRDGKLYVQLSTYEGKPNHPFTGYYLPYPDSNFDGLVSTISKEPPQLNWIFLHKESWQICCGLRVEADRQLPGPWGAKVCSNGEKRFIMEDWEGFIAVETEETGLWGLYFDKYNNGLKGKVTGDWRTVEIELIREEMED